MTRDTAIHVITADQVITGAEQLESCVHGRHAAREADSVLTTFNGSKIVLEDLSSWVGGPGVIKSLVPTDLVEHIGRCFIDRRKDRAGGGVRCYSGTNNFGVKFQRTISCWWKAVLRSGWLSAIPGKEFEQVDLIDNSDDRSSIDDDRYIVVFKDLLHVIQRL